MPVLTALEAATLRAAAAAQFNAGRVFTVVAAPAYTDCGLSIDAIDAYHVVDRDHGVVAVYWSLPLALLDANLRATGAL